MLAQARRSPAQQPDSAHATEAPPSLLGPHTRITGILEMDGELVISGRVTGKIAAQKLIIAAGGFVEGDIVAGEVVIRGQFNGRVFAPTVTIEDGAEVDGRIFHTHVTMARGARFTGRMPWRPISYFETLDKLPEARP
jgi:cytoskeletal protein CcmA (bactofilin family)